MTNIEAGTSESDLSGEVKQPRVEVSRQRLDEVLAECEAGAGVNFAVRTIFRMIRELEKYYGDDFNPTEALRAVEELASVAHEIAEELKTSELD